MILYSHQKSLYKWTPFQKHTQVEHVSEFALIRAGLRSQKQTFESFLSFFAMIPQMFHNILKTGLHISTVCLVKKEKQLLEEINRELVSRKAKRYWEGRTFEINLKADSIEKY